MTRSADAPGCAVVVRRRGSPTSRSAVAPAVVLVTGLLLGGCAAAGAGSAAAGEADWRALALPRPEPLPGAARISIGGVGLAGTLPWSDRIEVSPELGVEELVVTGLLRRRDVHFVERRRFSAAAAAERAGEPRPAGAPRAGVSPGAEWSAAAVWLPLSTSESTIEVRLVDPRTGIVQATARSTLPGAPAPLVLARAVVSAIRDALASIGRLPAWEDPIVEGGGSTSEDDVPEDAVLHFLHGLAAEERWAWEEARTAYGAAARERGFHEARAALARAARLRLGGTLGAS